MKDLDLLRNLIDVVIQQTKLMFRAVEAEDSSTLLRLLKSREAILHKIGDLVAKIEEISPDIIGGLREIVNLNDALTGKIALKQAEIGEMIAKTKAFNRMATKYGGIKESSSRFVDLSVG